MGISGMPVFEWVTLGLMYEPVGYRGELGEQLEGGLQQVQALLGSVESARWKVEPLLFS